MKPQIINVTPDKEGKIFITLFGTTYQIVIDKPKAKETKKEEK